MDRKKQAFLDAITIGKSTNLLNEFNESPIDFPFDRVKEDCDGYHWYHHLKEKHFCNYPSLLDYFDSNGVLHTYLFPVPRIFEFLFKNLEDGSYALSERTKHIRRDIDMEAILKSWFHIGFKRKDDFVRFKLWL